MILNNILIISVLLAAGLILVASDWRLRIAGLASLYLIAFILILQIWPIALASIKLISGWMGISLISAAKLNTMEDYEEHHQISELVFRLLLTVLIWIVLAATAPKINEWLPIPYTNLFIGISLISAGIIFTSLINQFQDTVIGILTFLVGFDVIYSSLEGSALVTGIFALITILISLLSGYFSYSDVTKDTE